MGNLNIDEINLYPEMNEMVEKLLWDCDEPSYKYAAALIKHQRSRAEKRDKQLSEKYAEIATLRRALEMACDDLNSWRNRTEYSNADRYIQQAQEEK